MFRAGAGILETTWFNLHDETNLILAFAYLRHKLERRYRRLDEHFLTGGVEDALFHHLLHPEGFDTSRGVPLIQYLAMRARSYLHIRMRSESRRRRHEKTIGVAEKNFEKILSENGIERCITIGKAKVEEQIHEWREALDALAARLNARDRAGVELLRRGASLKEWVRHLGIQQLILEQQRSKVYKEKDRLKHKLKRMARNVQGGGVVALPSWSAFEQQGTKRVESPNHG